MSFLLLPYLASAAFSFSIGVHAANHLRVRAAPSFVVMAFAQAFWTSFYILELVSPDLAQKTFWDTLQWITAIVSSTAALHFCAMFVQQQYRLHFRLMSVVGACLMFLLVVNGFHPLVEVDRRIIESPPFNALFYPYTLLDWAGIVYMYAAFITGTVMLIFEHRHSHAVYRSQLEWVILGLISGLVLTISTSILDIRILGQRDLTPFAFVLYGIFITWGIFRQEMFNVGVNARRLVIEGMRDAFIVTNTALRIIDLNSAARRLAQDADGNLEGRLAVHTFPDWLVNLVYRSAPSPAAHEVRLDDSQGARTVEVRTQPVLDKNQLQVAQLTTIRDITTLKQMQDQQVALRLEREHAALVAQFIRTASHEFRTPLATIGTSMYLMQRSTNADHVERHRLKAENEIARLTRLIEDLELMAILDSGADLRREATRIDAMIDFVVVKMATVAQQNTIEIATRIQTELPAQQVDPDKLGAALIHLLDNAIRYAMQGSRVTITLDSDGNNLCIDFINVGPGILPEDMAHIFERFWRKDSAHSTPGFGLGLSIAQRVAELHGGGLAIASVPGAETKATLYFPASPSI